MFFFLIAGLGFIRLKDKGKLIKYVNVWSLFLLLLSKFWNVVIWLESPFCDSLWMKKSWWERPDGLAMCVNDWPVSIFNFPDAAMNCRAQTRIRKPPLNGVPCDFMTSWLWSFHEVKKNKQTEKKTVSFADLTCSAHFHQHFSFELGVPVACLSFPPLSPSPSHYPGG